MCHSCFWYTSDVAVGLPTKRKRVLNRTCFRVYAITCMQVMDSKIRTGGKRFRLALGRKCKRMVVLSLSLGFRVSFSQGGLEEGGEGQRGGQSQDRDVRLKRTMAIIQPISPRIRGTLLRKIDIVCSLPMR